ncbi:hypothetical protein LMG31506_00200 [Cupriavidus yeoncheonensis]|uniref:Uncharacterized protein n=1 Tax=Cupriavidus yeoncheonensis TaxID=1462994 RepID=A0A916IPC9_9BURK|nr:hypothetical protein [Cupriavidus yeoncheonensis]CAG2126843.1 hypothetical protein LMG31506_00200 [Cupriavidus yeoncheonensis]
MTTFTITHNDTTLQVSGTYRRGHDATLEQPGADECFELSNVTDSGVDVMHLHDLDEIAGLALEAYHDLQAYEECDATDRQSEERRFAFGVTV